MEFKKVSYNGVMVHKDNGKRTVYDVTQHLESWFINEKTRDRINYCINNIRCTGFKIKDVFCNELEPEEVEETVMDAMSIFCK